MGLEHMLLNRLEARSIQLAQMKQEIYGLRQLVDEKMTVNEQLSEQITSARLGREQMQHQITELQTERDRILEISKSLVPKSALNQAVLEAAELHGALNDAQGEIQKLRAEVPLESTREALKNAVAELNPIKSALKVVHAVCGQYGMANGELLHDFIARIGEALAAERTRADNLSACRDRWMKIAADCGRMDGEDAGEFMARLAQQAAQGADLAVRVEELRVANIKQEQELEELRAFAKADNKRHGDLRDEMTAACRLAGSFGMRGDESLAQFVDRICGNKVVALEESVARLNAKVGPLEKLYEVVKKHVDHGAIIDNRADIYDAVAETAKALSQLTA